MVAEAVLGRPLPRGAVVHHVDGTRDNNDPSNLVICQDQAYHMLLHARQRVVDMGGNPNVDKYCTTCKALHPREDFPKNRNRPDGLGLDCRASANARRRGKYNVWNERRAETQRIRRANAAAHRR